MPGGHPQYPGGGQQQGLHAGYRPSNYGQRNYGYRSSGRSRSHNSSLSSHGSAAAGHKPSAADFALTNGLVRSSGRSSSRRSSKRRQRPRPAMSDTASTVSNTSSVSNQRSSTMSSSVAGGAGYTPYSPPARSSDDSGVTPSGRHRGGKKGGPFANMTGRGIGATIGIVAGIISGGTGLMMLVMGFSGAGGAAMYFVGAFLIVGGIVGIAVGAGICMCCKRTDGQTDGRDEDSRDAEDASMEVQSSPQTAASSNNNYKYPKTNGSSSMLTGGGALNTAYVEDAGDSVPTVAAHVPPYPSNPYTPQPPPAANTGRVPVTLQVPSVAQPQPVSSFSEAQASVVLSRGPAASFQPIQAAPSVATETAARPTPTTLVFEPVVKKPATVQQQQQQQEEEDNNNKSGAVMQQNNSHNKSVVKPRPTLLPLTNVPPPPPAAELTSGRPAVKLPVPIRSPVINMNPMPPAKKSKQQKQQQWAAGGGGGTPQSSFSDTNNTDASNSSADESGLRGGSTGNSSMETDASTTGEGEGRRGQKVKKRVSFSDEKKGSKAKRKKKLRQSLEHESSNSANESGGPRGILAKKVDSEDLRYVSAPERVRENTQLNRGRERSSSRDRNSRRTSRSRSPGQRPPLHPGGQPTHPATAAGKRGRQQPTGPAPLQTHRPKPPLDTSDPAVQSRQRRNSRRKKVPAAGSPSPHDGEVASLSQVRFSFGGQGAAAGGDGGYVNAALEMDSPTSPAAASLPMATSSPTPLHQQNTSNHGNLVFESPPPSSWQPAGRSTPPTPNTSVQLVALHTNSSTETEI